MQAVNYIRQVNYYRISWLEQSYPNINPFTLFPSFDYVSKPYADILDSIATIFGLWFALAAITRLSHAVYGKSTRTVALREMIDRLTTFNISSFYSLRKRCYKRPQVEYLSGLTTRFLSLLFFILLFGAEALAVFSQTSRRLTLDDLKLKQLSFKVPSDPPPEIKLIPTGPNLLMDLEASKVKVPLYLVLIVDVQGYSAYEGKLKFIISIANERSLRIRHQSNKSNFIEFRYSVEIRDESSGTHLLLNLSKCGFNISQRKLSWLESRLNETYPSVNFQSHYINSITSHFYGNAKPNDDNIVYFEKFRLFVESMFSLSNVTLKSGDFISKDGENRSKNHDLNGGKFYFGKVKRLSGVILWIIAVLFGMINFFVGLMTWDMDDDINAMIAECLAISPTVSPRFVENVAFRIVDVGSSDTCSVDEDDRESSDQNMPEKLARLKLEVLQ